MPTTQTEEYQNRRSEFSRHLLDMIYNEISFSGEYKSCCVGIVDAVNSTNTTAKLVNGQLCKYYGIFLNAMAIIAKDFGGIVVKNIGDSLLYYFPKTAEETDISAFKATLECSMAMIESHSLINKVMIEEHLPPVDYRVSLDYGNVMIAKTLNSSIDDIFGATVNICAKINTRASSNSIVIGGDLHQLVKNFKEYSFSRITAFSSGLKLDYPIFRMSRGKSGKWFVF